MTGNINSAHFVCGDTETEIQENLSIEEHYLNTLNVYRVWGRSHFFTAAYTCEICLRKFCIGDYVRCLPCKHRYHSHCIENWLRHVGLYCPVDRIKLVKNAEYDSDFDEEEDATCVENIETKIEEAAKNLRAAHTDKPVIATIPPSPSMPVSKTMTKTVPVSKIAPAPKVQQASKPPPTLTTVTKSILVSKPIPVPKTALVTKPILVSKSVPVSNTASYESRGSSWLEPRVHSKQDRTSSKFESENSNQESTLELSSRTHFSLQSGRSSISANEVDPISGLWRNANTPGKYLFQDSTKTTELYNEHVQKRVDEFRKEVLQKALVPAGDVRRLESESTISSVSDQVKHNNSEPTTSKSKNKLPKDLEDYYKRLKVLSFSKRQDEKLENNNSVELSEVADRRNDNVEKIDLFRADISNFSGFDSRCGNLLRNPAWSLRRR